MSEYKEVLYKWAHEKLTGYSGLDGRTIDRVESVEFRYDEGYAYSSYTYEDPSFKVEVRFFFEDVEFPQFVTLYDDDTETMGQLLTELFQIAERED